MKTIKIPTIGDTRVLLPESYCARTDIIAAYGQAMAIRKGAVLLRVRIAAVGLCCPDLKTVRYNVSNGEIIAYGGLVINDLVGVRGMDPLTLSEIGETLIQLIDDAMPKKAEVDATVDFSSAPEDDQTDP